MKGQRRCTERKWERWQGKCKRRLCEEDFQRESRVRRLNNNQKQIPKQSSRLYKSVFWDWKPSHVPTKWITKTTHTYTIIWWCWQTLSIKNASIKANNKMAQCSFQKPNTKSCCCCCWVASVMSNSVRPHRRRLTGLPRPWDSPGENTGVGCHFLLQCRKVKVKSLSRVRLLATPWTAAHQAPPSTGFSRQKYWSGVPLPSPQ